MPDGSKLKVFTFGFSIFLVFFIILLAGYAKSYSGKILLNSYLLNENVSGRDIDYIKEKVARSENDSKTKEVKLRYQDHEYSNSLENLGWDLKEQETADLIYRYGHSDNSLRNALSYIRSIFAKKKFEVVYTVNQKLIDDWIVSINSEIANPKIETNIIVKNSQATIVEPKAGTKINEDKLKSELDRIFVLSIDNDLNLELIESLPVISIEQAEQLTEDAISKSKEAITLVGPGSNVQISPNTLGSMIELKSERGKPVYVSLNDSKVRSYIEENASILAVEPVDALFSISSGNVILIRPSVAGEAVIVNEATNKVVDVFEEGKEKSVELPYESQEPAVSAQNASDIEKFGIKELIGKATTNFSGSPDNRVHNIKNGVKYISGVLVKPDEEFSTIGKLGQIDESSGYLPELVIKEDETVPEFGGGLCQVSTTLFRAAMDAGLKITERQNHSYRVSYYEPPVGMDATIYSPKPDLKFVNTTGHAILVYGYVTGSNVTFEIYGTDDGRIVEITTPEVYDITSPPETIYIDDPSLEPGEEKRIDRAHDGAKAVFYYKVRKNGELINEQKFLSYYVAWPAKYLRGPQPEGEKPAEGTEDGQPQN